MNRSGILAAGALLLALSGCPDEAGPAGDGDAAATADGDVTSDGAPNDGATSDGATGDDATTDGDPSDGDGAASDGAPADASPPDAAADAGPDGTLPFDPTQPGGVFSAVGYAGLYMKSYDMGLTWDVIGDDGSGGDDATLYRNMHWLNGVYLRVGNQGRGFWVSSDNGTWTDVAGDAGLGQWIGGVAYGNGLWVGGGGCGTTMVSSDGVTWTSHYNAVGQDGCEHARTIAFGNGAFVEVGNNGSVAFSATSTDGETWSDYQEFTEWGWHTVEFAFGKFWVARNDGSGVMTSIDGVTWDTAPVPAYDYQQLSFCAGRLMLPTGDGVMLVTTDGTTFTELDAPSMNRVVYGGGVYIGSTWNDQMRSDDDGATWTSLKATEHAVQRFIYAPQ